MRWSNEWLEMVWYGMANKSWRLSTQHQVWLLYWEQIYKIAHVYYGPRLQVKFYLIVRQNSSTVIFHDLKGRQNITFHPAYEKYICIFTFCNSCITLSSHHPSYLRESLNSSNFYFSTKGQRWLPQSVDWQWNYFPRNTLPRFLVLAIQSRIFSPVDPPDFRFSSAVFLLYLYVAEFILKGIFYNFIYDL